MKYVIKSGELYLTRTYDENNYLPYSFETNINSAFIFDSKEKCEIIIELEQIELKNGKVSEIRELWSNSIIVSVNVTIQEA